MQADLEFVKLINELEIEMAEEKVRKPRKTKAQKEAENAQTTKSLIDALKFLKFGQSKAGTNDQVFCQLKNHWAIIKTDGLAMGTPIDEDLDACPHTYNLLAALSSCKAELLITQPSAFDLNIKSGGFNADVNCIDGFEEELTCFGIQDKPIIRVEDNSIILALETLGKLTAKTPTNAVFGSVMLQSSSAVATDGFAILEYWHGIHLPPNMMIPKVAIDAIVGCKKDLKFIGISEVFHQANGSPMSITFFFDDTSWIKVDLPDTQYIAYSHLFDSQTEQQPLPNGFIEAVKSLNAVSNDAIAIFEDYGIRTTNGAAFELEGLPCDIAFEMNYLLQFVTLINTISFDVGSQQALFYGDRVRGLLKAVEL